MHNFNYQFTFTLSAKRILVAISPFFVVWCAGKITLKPLAGLYLDLVEVCVINQGRAHVIWSWTQKKLEIE